MSNGPLPLQIEPRKLADRGVHLSDKLPLAGFARLAELITQTAGKVQVWLEFSRDAKKHALMHLRLSTKVAMQCQRCLDEAWFPLEQSCRYLVSNSDVE